MVVVRFEARTQPREVREEDSTVSFAIVAERLRKGLSRRRKSIDPMLLYDARGSQLFEEICALDAYYLTRSEHRLLGRYAQSLTDRAGDVVTVVELGSGSCIKTEILLRALAVSGRRVRYVPIDISRTAIEQSTQRFRERLGAIDVFPMLGTYDEGLERVGAHIVGEPLGLFLGSNLGNFAPLEAIFFLRRIRRALGDAGALLLGLDLIKEAAVLERAYDDEHGVTATFSLNLLHRLNREFDADFDVDGFAHRAHWDPRRASIEIALESLRRQEVCIGRLGMRVRFEAGEAIHTESAYKYDRARIERLAQQTGWKVDHHWVDPDPGFSLNLFVPGGSR